MKKKIFGLLLSSSMMFSWSNSFGQTGAFNFTNSTDCDVSATVYAFDGECDNITNCTSTGNNGAMTVAAHSTVDIGTGYTGMGAVWGKVEVNGSSVYDGDPSCFSSNGTISCGTNDPVSWNGCHNASLP